MKYFITFSALFTFLFFSFAFAITPQPAKCPEIDAIQNVGLKFVKLNNRDSVWDISQVDHYGTLTTWSFSVWVPFTDTSNPDDALGKAKAILPYLSGNPIPVPFEEEGEWICYYNDFSNGYKAHAETLGWIP